MLLLHFVLFFSYWLNKIWCLNWRVLEVLEAIFLPLGRARPTVSCLSSKLNKLHFNRQIWEWYKCFDLFLSWKAKGICPTIPLCPTLPLLVWLTQSIMCDDDDGQDWSSIFLQTCDICLNCISPWMNRCWGRKRRVFFGWELFGEFGNQSVRAVTAAGCCHRKCQAGKSIDCFLTTKTQTVKTLQQAGNPAQLFYLNVACSLFWS